MLSLLAGLAGPIVETAGGFLRRRQERRAAEASSRAKLKQTAQDDTHAREMGAALSRAEWEAIGRRAEAGTWKDEFVTVLVSLPLLTLFLGALLEPFGVPEVFAAGERMIAALNSLDGVYGTLLLSVLLAAVGIRWIRR